MEIASYRHRTRAITSFWYVNNGLHDFHTRTFQLSFNVPVSTSTGRTYLHSITAAMATELLTKALSSATNSAWPGNVGGSLRCAVRETQTRKPFRRRRTDTQSKRSETSRCGRYRTFQKAERRGASCASNARFVWPFSTISSSRLCVLPTPQSPYWHSKEL